MSVQPIPEEVSKAGGAASAEQAADKTTMHSLRVKLFDHRPRGLARDEREAPRRWAGSSLLAALVLAVAVFPPAGATTVRNLTAQKEEHPMKTSTARLEPQSAADAAIRPFRVNITEGELADLRRRIEATRFPEKETVRDNSQGVPLATVRALAEYWATDYDWRKCEAKLNAYPQFITAIDGLDIHFIHVRSKEKNALPVIITHGWPGSIVEQLKLIDPLVNPTAHGGLSEDAFDVVIPDMPGYGFSGKPTVTGWGPDHIARAWVVLMKRLGYTKFVAQGGDWGAIVVDLMGVQAPPELLGIHTNMAGVIPVDLDQAAFAGRPAPAGLSADEKLAYDRLCEVYAKGIGYGFQMGLRP